MEISGWVTFKQIVDDIMLSWGDASDHGQFLRYLNFAIKGYQKLRLSSFPATKPIDLPVSMGERRTVVLPDDYLDFVSIGITSGGRFQPFVPNSDMIQDKGDHRGQYSYSLDIENRRIIIDTPRSVTNVTFHYTPTGIKSDGVTYIPRMAMDVIIAYVEREITARDKGTSSFDKQDFAIKYAQEMEIFRGLQYDVDEMYNAYYLHLATGKQY